ncbi:cellulase family glycosylhydrolase [Bacillus pacificus]|uniref:cellulase family glycosylhydrolase n=1 Tax=Bacillus pacificus TaxID=2026187 RepID=UPI003D25CDBD
MENHRVLTLKLMVMHRACKVCKIRGHTCVNVPVYNDDYLDKVAERVDWYKKQGIHVMLDMHQDLYSEFILNTGTGNGAPKWAVYTDGLPAKKQSPWPLTYLQPGVMRAFDHFWNIYGKHPELQEHYSNMWRYVASKFVHNDAIIGYDIMNEPFGGIQPWPIFEMNSLSSMYQKTINKIREVDQKNWIFYEPQAFGVNQGLASTLSTLNDPRLGEQRLAYIPHLYPLLTESDLPYTGITKMIVKNTIQQWSENRKKEASHYQTPIVLGEFQISSAKPGASEYVNDVIDMISSIGSGYAYWENYKGFWEDTDNINNLIGRLARPYPRAIGGQPIYWNFDINTNIFEVKWRTQNHVSGPTELFISPKYYPNGWEIQTDEDGTWEKEWNPERNILKIYTTSTANHYFKIIPKTKS